MCQSVSYMLYSNTSHGNEFDPVVDWLPVAYSNDGLRRNLIECDRPRIYPDAARNTLFYSGSRHHESRAGSNIDSSSTTKSYSELLEHDGHVQYAACRCLLVCPLR